MSCAHAHDVGAYLLGALPTDEHDAFETHLRDCASCRAEVDELGDLPGLLALADAPDEDRAPIPEVPTELLAGTLTRVRRRRRRRRTLVAVGAVAAAVAAFLAGLGISSLDAPPVTRTVALASVGGAPVQGAAELTPVAWGTRLQVDCIARRGAPPAAPTSGPPTVYVLVLRAADGSEQQVARWSPPPGADVRIDASTDLPAVDVSSMEVRTTSGRVVMAG